MMNDSPNDHCSMTSDSITTTAVGLATDWVTGSSLPAPIRRNAVKAFSQLCSAAIEIPVAYLEGIAAEKRAETAGRVKIIGTTAEQIAQQMKVDPEYARIAVKKFGQKVIREQINLDNISNVAANELKSCVVTEAKPPPDTNGKPEEAINQDWLNNFEKEACQKSTEEMQLLFGRILAGEIKRPTSFSIKTVKLLGELDTVTAQLFQKLRSACVVVQIPGDNQIIDARVLSLGGNASSNALENFGLSYSQLNILHEHGLIISSYNSWFDYGLCVVGEKQVNLPILHQGKQWILRPIAGRLGDQSLKFTGVSLSRSGEELLQIIGTEPMEEYTKALKNFFETQKLQFIPIGITPTIKNGR